MKRILTALVALILLLPSVAFADVILEPENSFFRAHESECQHLEGRTYIANGPDGNLPLYSAPNGTLIHAIPNGETFYCQWVYLDKQGYTWGYSERHELWTLLGYTLVQYDHIAFEADHQGELLAGDGRTLSKDIPSILFYNYPGSPNKYPMDQMSPFAPEQLYVDQQGRTWGFTSYYYGWRNMWVCLDDPTNDALSEEAPAPLPSGFEAPKSMPRGTGMVLVIAVVASVAAISLATALILFRRKKAAK